MCRGFVPLIQQLTWWKSKFSLHHHRFWAQVWLLDCEFQRGSYYVSHLLFIQWVSPPRFLPTSLFIPSPIFRSIPLYLEFQLSVGILQHLALGPLLLSVGIPLLVNFSGPCHPLSSEGLKGNSNTCSEQNSGTFSLRMRTFSHLSTHFPLPTAATSRFPSRTSPLPLLANLVSMIMTPSTTKGKEQLT